MYQNNFDSTTSRVNRNESLLATHTVLRNTYFLLSLTLLFSAGIAWLAMAMNAPYPGILITIIGIFGLMFLTMKLRNSVWGLVSVFAFTGFIGYTMGPMLNMFIHTYSNGGQLIMTAMS
jgi:modulator of FtsH protease